MTGRLEELGDDGSVGRVVLGNQYLSRYALFGENLSKVDDLRAVAILCGSSMNGVAKKSGRCVRCNPAYTRNFTESILGRDCPGLIGRQIDHRSRRLVTFSSDSLENAGRNVRVARHQHGSDINATIAQRPQSCYHGRSIRYRLYASTRRCDYWSDALRSSQVRKQ